MTRTTSLICIVTMCGLLGLVVTLSVPTVGYTQSESNFLGLYGMATITQYDKQGEEVFSQTVHNRLFDSGEDFILNQTFAGVGSSAVADNIQIGAVCLSAAALSTDETHTSVAFNTAHDAAEDISGSDDTSKNCKTAATATNTDQVVTFATLTFTSKNDNSGNWYAGETITHIGVCTAESADADVRGCDKRLFAVVDTTDITLADGETVTVTYSFNLSSGTS